MPKNFVCDLFDAFFKFWLNLNSTPVNNSIIEDFTTNRWSVSQQFVQVQNWPKDSKPVLPQGKFKSWTLKFKVTHADLLVSRRADTRIYYCILQNKNKILNSDLSTYTANAIFSVPSIKICSSVYRLPSHILSFNYDSVKDIMSNRWW